MTRLVMNKVPRSFYDRSADAVAKDLLGTYLVHEDGGITRIGRIVETEAYLGPHDSASHSARGKTPRTRVMFGPPGHAYVYLIYGMYHCMNVVTGPEGQASAVLLRALEPVKNTDGKTGGPGLLCRAMHIDRRFNARDLTGDDLYIAASPDAPPVDVIESPRIGVAYAGDWAGKPLRYTLKGNRFVSRKP